MKFALANGQEVTIDDGQMEAALSAVAEQPTAVQASMIMLRNPTFREAMSQLPTSIWPILISQLPAIITLVMAVVRDMREGKSFIEALIPHVESIAKIVMALIGGLKDNGESGPVINT